jgi:hypothetical protein
MSQSWRGLAGCKVAESDGENAFCGGVVDDHLLPTGQGVTRGFFVGRVFGTEEEGGRGVPMGIKHEPVSPIIPIAYAKRLQESIAIVHVVHQVRRGVRPLLESDGNRRASGVVVSENDQDKSPLYAHLESFDRYRKRGDAFRRNKRSGLWWLRRCYEDGTREAKNGAERKSFHGIPSMGANSQGCWNKT